MAWVCPACEYENEDEDVTCAACEEARPAQAAGEADEDDAYRNIKVGTVTACEDAAGTKLKRLKVDVGAGAPIDIVTAATNVVEGATVVVACVGAVIKDEEVKKANVRGFPSNGMLCDSGMLGWTGGGAGAAVLLPPSFKPGDRPPSTRPRGDAL